LLSHFGDIKDAMGASFCRFKKEEKRGKQRQQTLNLLNSLVLSFN